MAESKQSLARREAPGQLGLETWAPFRDLGFSSRLNRIFDEFFGDRSFAGAVAVPPVDISETEDSYVVTAEIPGVGKEDLKLELEGGVLTIAGEKKSEREEKQEKGRRLERTFGAFSRSFTLPADAEAEKVDASFKQGVLRVSIPKRPGAKAKAIAIK